MSARKDDARALLRAIVAELPFDAARGARAFDGVRDWRELLATARSHGLGSVVSLYATEVGAVLPTDIAKEHAAYLAREDMRQESLRRALVEVTDVLSAAGVEHLALKGPALAARLYPRNAVRPSTDLDVLVSPASVEHVVSALAPLGYALEGGASGAFFREHHHHVHLFHRARPVIELHVEAYRGFGTSMRAEPLLGRAVACGAEPFPSLRVPSPEDEWLYLAVHAASHRFERLGWLYDLKLLSRSPRGLRWDVIAARARELRLSRTASLTARVLAEWIDCDLDGFRELAPLGRTRVSLAELLSAPRESHLANALASFGFAALACDSDAVATFATRFVRVKVLHEAPLRARAFLAS